EHGDVFEHILADQLSRHFFAVRKVDIEFSAAVNNVRVRHDVAVLPRDEARSHTSGLLRWSLHLWLLVHLSVRHAKRHDLLELMHKVLHAWIHRLGLLVALKLDLGLDIDYVGHRLVGQVGNPVAVLRTDIQAGRERGKLALGFGIVSSLNNSAGVLVLPDDYSHQSHHHDKQNYRKRFPETVASALHGAFASLIR